VKLFQLFHFFNTGSLIAMMILPVFSQSDSEKKISLLILTGGHDFEREAFFEMFDTFANVTYKEVVHPEANDIYLNGQAEKADVLVFYDMMDEISEKQKQAMTAILKKGKPCLFLHHALASYQNWPEFINIIGGQYIISDDSTKPGSTYRHDVAFTVRISKTNHPVTQGLKDFKIYDEVYGAFKVKEDCKPLLETNHPESGPVIAWINTYGNSPVVYIQPGHDHHGYENPQYRRLLHQAILWLYNNK
jgi:type 1 glutamine amidotransferase